MMYLRMGRMFLVSAVLSATSIITIGQQLPAGKWRLEEYKFGSASEHPLKGIATTLVIKTNGNLGGDTGCNAYGGTYTREKGKLAITDIISTMRACDEPMPMFEKDFFNTLENATSAKVRDNTLMITDKKGHYLRFVRDK